MTTKEFKEALLQELRVQLGDYTVSLHTGRPGNRVMSMITPRLNCTKWHNDLESAVEYLIDCMIELKLIEDEQRPGYEAPYDYFIGVGRGRVSYE